MADAITILSNNWSDSNLLVNGHVDPNAADTAGVRLVDPPNSGKSRMRRLPPVF